MAATMVRAIRICPAMEGCTWSTISPQPTPSGGAASAKAPATSASTAPLSEAAARMARLWLSGARQGMVSSSRALAKAARASPGRSRRTRARPFRYWSQALRPARASASSSRASAPAAASGPTASWSSASAAITRCRCQLESCPAGSPGLPVPAGAKPASLAARVHRITGTPARRQVPAMRERLARRSAGADCRRGSSSDSEPPSSPRTWIRSAPVTSAPRTRPRRECSIQGMCPSARAWRRRLPRELHRLPAP